MGPEVAEVVGRGEHLGCYFVCPHGPCVWLGTQTFLDEGDEPGSGELGLECPRAAVVEGLPRGDHVLFEASGPLLPAPLPNPLRCSAG